MSVDLPQEGDEKKREYAEQITSACQRYAGYFVDHAVPEKTHERRCGRVDAARSMFEFLIDHRSVVPDPPIRAMRSELQKCLETVLNRAGLENGTDQARTEAELFFDVVNHFFQEGFMQNLDKKESARNEDDHSLVGVFSRRVKSIFK